MTNTTSLTKYEAAKHALAAARSVDEVKDINDKAIALKAYAKQAKDKKLEADAHAIRMRAERRLGQMMEEQKKTIGLNKGGKSEHRNRVSKKPGKPTLGSQGIDKNLADRSRKAAAMPEQQFEQKVQEDREQITAPAPKTVNAKPKSKKGAVRGIAKPSATPPKAHRDSATCLAEFKTACDHWLPKLNGDDLKKARAYFQDCAEAREKRNATRATGSAEQSVEERKALDTKLAEEEERPAIAGREATKVVNEVVAKQIAKQTENASAQ